MAGVAYVSHAEYRLHVQGPTHPERPERVIALAEYLPKTDIWPKLRPLTPEPAPIETLELVHSSSYIDLVDYVCRQGGGLVDGVETGAVAESFAIARRAVGAVTLAIDSVMAGVPGAGRADCAFCAVRPPGHHALRDRAMGFCLFNNVAIGARYAQKRHGVERVLIIDWDLHHGNGTQAMFWTDPTVFYFSVHCYPAYPGTGRKSEIGEGAGEGYTLNAPLPPGAGSHEYSAVFDEVLAPAFARFCPDLVLISAGFDAHANDPLSRMLLRTEDFRTLTDRVTDLAQKSAGGRIVSVLEGGYNPQALARSVEQHLCGLVQ